MSTFEAMLIGGTFAFRPDVAVMIFAAIDPGSVNAAIAVFHDHTPVFVDDIRTVNGMLDATAFAHAMEDMKVERVVVENVHSMPKQGVSSSFKFGMGCGIIHGVAGALRLPLTLVTPNAVEDLPQPPRPEQGSLAHAGDPEVARPQPPPRPSQGRRSRRGPADRRLVLRPLHHPPQSLEVFA